MIRKQLYIDEDLNNGLRILAASSGRSEAEHVRAALRQYLRREHCHPAGGEDALLEMIGLVNDQDGPDDVATQHDRYLYDASRSA